jgi:hypothetical protein
MMAAMASLSSSLRSACPLLLALGLIAASCGPSHVAVRRGDDDGGPAEPDSGETGGTGGTGGVTMRLDAAADMNRGGTGGTAMRDSAVDPPPPPPDMAVVPPPDVAPDKPPATGPETGGAGKTVLLVMGYVTPKDPALKPGDAKIKDHLEARGFTVRFGDDDDGDASKAAGTNLVIVTQTTGETRIGNKYNGVQVPLICLNGTVFDDMQMTAAEPGGTANLTMVAITNMAHPLAAGLSGSVSVIGSSTAATWGLPAAAGERIATVPGQANQVTIFGYPSGAMMASGTAPAKRVGLFITEAMAVGMNDTGWKLFDAAVDWSLQ